jgi:hypothetical protein
MICLPNANVFKFHKYSSGSNFLTFARRFLAIDEDAPPAVLSPGRRKSSIGTMISGLHASYDFGMEVVLCEGCFDEN